MGSAPRGTRNGVRVNTRKSLQVALHALSTRLNSLWLRSTTRFQRFLKRRGDHNMKQRRFAEGTSVEARTSKHELEDMLAKHGAHGFLTAWLEENGTQHSLVQFQISGRMVKYIIRMPTAEEVEKTGTGQTRHKPELIEKARQAEYRRRWRALILIIKAKLEMVAGGDSTFEREFLADIMLTNGSTVGDMISGQLAAMYTDGKLPRLLGAG